MLNEGTLKRLIGVTILINAVVMLFSILPAHDPALYADIAKHMVLTNDWANLVFNHTDWLDKPHFPFWITALSCKFFGFSSFAYIFPGFVFHLIGAYYTYLLGCYLFNKQMGLLAVLFYVTAAHLLLSSIDVRAEAYLLGEIMPACYYWWRYHDHPKIKLNYLFSGAFFTALAMMTKGIFVLVTIAGGFITLWFYHLLVGRHRETAKNRPQPVLTWFIKWVSAGLLSFLFIAPELITLYLQFDLHPEKIVFNQTHVSGIKWFFWDSQIGRFFNGGPISGHTHSFHYLFFTYTFLWAFLPWSFLFIAATYWIIISLCSIDSRMNRHQRKAYFYLLGAFFPTFCMFSASSFQLDHYTNIIIPFAAMMCAGWVCHKQDASAVQSRLYNAIVYPTMLINLIFIGFMVVNRHNYIAYDVGYKIAEMFVTSNPLS